MSDAVTESWTLYGVGVAATLLRFYARMRVDGFRSLQAEDYLMGISIVGHFEAVRIEMILILTGLLYDPDDACIQYWDTRSWSCQQWNDGRRTGCIVHQRS